MSVAPSAPDVPAFAESGVKGAEALTRYGVASVILETAVTGR